MNIGSYSHHGGYVTTHHTTPHHTTTQHTTYNAPHTTHLTPQHHTPHATRHTRHTPHTPHTSTAAASASAAAAMPCPYTVTAACRNNAATTNLPPLQLISGQYPRPCTTTHLTARPVSHSARLDSCPTRPVSDSARLVAFFAGTKVFIPWKGEIAWVPAIVTDVTDDKFTVQPEAIEGTNEEAVRQTQNSERGRGLLQAQQPPHLFSDAWY